MSLNLMKRAFACPGTTFKVTFHHQRQERKSFLARNCDSKLQVELGDQTKQMMCK